MKKMNLFFWLNIILAALFLVSSLTLLPGEINRAAPDVPTWYLIHEISGTLMLALAALHLVLHWGWVKALLARRGSHHSKTVRRNFRTDLGMFLLALPCAIAGILAWIIPGSESLTGLHNWTGLLLLILLLVHLALHWQWFTKVARRLTATPDSLVKQAG